MDKKEQKNTFAIEESPSGSKAVAITKGRRKFKIKQILSQTKKVIAFGKPFHGYLYLSLLGVFTSTLFDLLIPVFIGRSIDAVVSAGNVNFDILKTNLLVIILLVWLSSIFSFIANYFSNVYCFKSSCKMRELIFKKFNTFFSVIIVP